MVCRKVAWPSGLRRWFKAPVFSKARVRIPPLPRIFAGAINNFFFTQKVGNISLLILIVVNLPNIIQNYINRFINSRGDQSVQPCTVDNFDEFCPKTYETFGSIYQSNITTSSN